MGIFEAILLGIVQGLTEFLPVSSTGHLVLIREIFGIDMHGADLLLFDTMVHVGTLVAVFVVLWKDILAILKKIFRPPTLYLIIGTIPAVIAGLAFRGQLETALQGGNYIGFAFLGTSALLVTAELLSRGRTLRKPGEMNWLDALVVGLCQAVAVIPGISRSGATLSGALSRGLNRDLAARFSFMLSIPIILGAALLQGMELLRGGESGVRETAAGGIGFLPLALGTVTSAVVGFFAVRLMLKIVRERKLWGFAIYTGILGLLVLIDRFFNVGIIFQA
ncbi:MAG: undecaprenyl-diphosphate phosphatase [Treponema sp.]|nr:undecaprenyl-diphosphate phosphatase [Treponema sp.]